MTKLQRVFRSALAIAAATALTGCYSVTYQMDDLNHVQVQGSYQKSFRFEVTNTHFIVGLVTPADPEIAAKIVNEVRNAGGRSARNIKLTHQHSFLDGLLAVVTLAIYTPTTVIVEGDIVK